MMLFKQKENADFNPQDPTSVVSFLKTREEDIVFITDFCYHPKNSELRNNHESILRLHKLMATREQNRLPKEERILYQAGLYLIQVEEAKPFATILYQRITQMMVLLEKKYIELGLATLFQNMLGVYERISENLKISEQCRSLRMGPVINHFIKASRERFETEIDKLNQLKQKAAHSIEQETKFLTIISGSDTATLSRSQAVNFNMNSHNASYEKENTIDELVVTATKKEKTIISIISSRKNTPNHPRIPIKNGRRSSTPGRTYREEFRLTNSTLQRELFKRTSGSIRANTQKGRANISDNSAEKNLEKVLERKSQACPEIKREVTPIFIEIPRFSEEISAQILTKDSQEKVEFSDEADAVGISQTDLDKPNEQPDAKPPLGISTAHSSRVNRISTSNKSSIEVANNSIKSVNFVSSCLAKPIMPSPKYSSKNSYLLQLDERSAIMLGRFGARKVNLKKIFDALLEGNASIQKARTEYYQAYKQKYQPSSAVSQTIKDTAFDTSQLVIEHHLEKNSLLDVTNFEPKEFVKAPLPEPEKEPRRPRSSGVRSSSINSSQSQVRKLNGQDKEKEASLEAMHGAVKDRLPALNYKIAYNNIDYDGENRPSSNVRTAINSQAASPADSRYLEINNSRRYFGKRVYETKAYDKDFRITEGKAILRQELRKKDTPRRHRDKSSLNSLDNNSAFNDINLSIDVGSDYPSELIPQDKSNLDSGAQLNTSNIEQKIHHNKERRQLRSLLNKSQEEVNSFRGSSMNQSYYTSYVLEANSKNQLPLGKPRRASPYLVRPQIK